MFTHETMAGAVPAPTKKLNNVLIHFRKRKKDGTVCTREGATVLVRPSKDVAGMYEVTYARCGKRDVFSRKIGRAIVEGRMRKQHMFADNRHAVLHTLHHYNEKYRERYDARFFERLLNRLA